MLFLKAAMQARYSTSTQIAPANSPCNEASLNVYDRAFAARLTMVLEQDLRCCKRVTLQEW